MGKKARWNAFSVGRAAILFGRGKTRSQVADYYWKRYGRQWGFSRGQMRGYLFDHSRLGNKPRFAELFEGKKPSEISRSFSEWKKTETAKRQKISDAFRQTPHPFKGKNLSLEHRQRIGRGLIGQKKSVLARRRMSESRKRYFKGIPPEQRALSVPHRQKLSISKKKYWKKPGKRQKASERMRRKWSIIRSNLLNAFKNRRRFAAIDQRQSEGQKRVVKVYDSPDRQMQETEKIRAVSTAIASLPVLQREIIRLVFFDSQSTNEVANALGKPLVAVEREFTAALKKLGQNRELQSLI